jgi:hypothetical protein
VEEKDTGKYELVSNYQISSENGLNQSGEASSITDLEEHNVAY